MSAIYKAQRYALFHFIPGYFDIDDGFVQKIVVEPRGIKEYYSSSEEAPSLDRQRLEWIVLDRIKTYPVSNRPSNAELDTYTINFVTHQYVRKTLEPDVFHCVKCGKLYSTRDLPRTRSGGIAFQCTGKCEGDLRQIPFLWVHSECGSVEPFRASNCPVCQRKGLSPTNKLRLHLNNNDVSKSFWHCTCGYSTQPSTDNPNAQRFTRPCVACSTQVASDSHMRVIPAIKVYRPQSFSTFKLTGDWHRLLAEWFGIKVAEPNLDGLPEMILKRMDRDPAFRQQILGTMQTEEPRELKSLLQKLGLEGEAGNRRVKQELVEFAGLRFNLEGRLRLVDADVQAATDTAGNILKRFGIEVSYLDSLPIVEGTFGSLVGTSDRQRARLVLIDGPTANQKWVFVREFMTEGLLFELPVEEVRNWLSKNGHDLADIRERLLSAPENDPAMLLVRKLLHSISHLLIRKSDIFSGVSRETLAEFLFPRSLAFLTYNTQGSEMGMLRTTFEGKMYNWLHAAMGGAMRCIYDPICSGKEVPCHGCMFIAERNCPLFNQDLDRDVLVRVRGDTKFGYWARS